VHNEAIDRALHEVQAARRDLTITGFCMRQAEAIRRLDRARANLADLVQSGSGKNKHSPTCVSHGPLQRLAGLGDLGVTQLAARPSSFHSRSEKI
jgi:hypothetical protein